MTPPDPNQDCDILPVVQPPDVSVAPEQVACDPPVETTPPAFISLPRDVASEPTLPPALPPALLVRSPRATSYCATADSNDVPTSLASETLGVAEFGQFALPVFWERVGIAEDGQAADITINSSALPVFRHDELYRLSESRPASEFNATGADLFPDDDHEPITYWAAAQRVVDAHLLHAVVSGDTAPVAEKLSDLLLFSLTQTSLLVALLAGEAGDAQAGDATVAFADQGGATINANVASTSTSGVFALAQMAAEGERVCVFRGRKKLQCVPPIATEVELDHETDHFEVAGTQETADADTITWWQTQAEIRACVCLNEEVTVSCPAGTLVGKVFTLADVANETTDGTDLITRIVVSAPDPITKDVEIEFFAGDDVVFSETRPAFSSTVSVSEANAEAVAFVSSRLDCRCGSSAVAVYCSPSDLDSAPTTAAIHGPHVEELIRRASMDAGLLQSKYTFSPVVFDLLAGKLRLNAGSGLVAVIGDSLVEDHALQLFTVSVPYNASVADMEAATAEADNNTKDWLRGFLRCSWYSPAYSCACAEVQGQQFDFVRHSGSQLDSYLAEHKVTLTTNDQQSFAAGAFEESTEPDDWSFLSEWCDATLACQFCNTAIPASCSTAVDVGDDILDTSGYSAKQLAVGGVISFLGRNTKGVADEVSSGLIADAVCGSDPMLVSAEAISRATERPRTGDAPTPGQAQLCSFPNPPFTASCSAKALVDAREYYDDSSLTPASEKARTFSEALHPDSASRIVSVPSGLFTVKAAASDAVIAVRQAMAAAKEYADSVLDCAYTNPNLRVFCGAARPTVLAPSLAFASKGFIVGSGKTGSPEFPVSCGSIGMRADNTLANNGWAAGYTDPALINYPPAGVDPTAGKCVSWSTGKSHSRNNPVFIPRGTIRSKERTPLPALDEAVERGMSSLDCFFEYTAAAYCPGATALNLPNTGDKTDGATGLQEFEEQIPPSTSVATDDQRKLMFAGGLMQTDNNHTSGGEDEPSAPHVAGNDGGGAANGPGQTTLHVLIDYDNGATPKFHPQPWVGYDARELATNRLVNRNPVRLYRTTLTTEKTACVQTEISRTSHAAAREAARQAALDRRVCLYANWMREASCPAGSLPDSAYGAIKVPTGMFAASTQAEANGMAEQHVASLASCSSCRSFSLRASISEDGSVRGRICGGGAVVIGGGGGAFGGGTESCLPECAKNKTTNVKSGFLYNGLTSGGCPTTLVNSNTLLPSSAISANQWVDFWIETRCCTGTGGKEIKNVLRESAPHGTGDLPGTSGYTPQHARTASSLADMESDSDAVWTYLGTIGSLQDATTQRRYPIVVQAVDGDIFRACSAGHPWQVRLGKQSANEVKVVPFSRFYKNTQTVEATNVGGYDDGKGTTLTVADGQYVYLEIAVSNKPDVSTVTLRGGALPASLDAEYYMLTTAGEPRRIMTQIIPIAKVIEEGEIRRVEQYVRNHIRLGLSVIDGYLGFVHYAS